MAKKKTSSKGRRKIEIKKIESEDVRHVCFSKRRSGLFTKASDLATLCGVELAIVVNSPAGNPYSFGNPGVSQVASQFFAGDAASSTAMQEGYKRSAVQEIGEECRELSYRLEIATAAKVKLQERVAALVEENPICRHAEDIEALGLTELMQLKESLEEVSGRAQAMVYEILRSTQRASSANVARGTNAMRAMVPMNQSVFGQLPLSR